MNKEGRMLKCRICPDCGRIMIQTMCIPYAELACIPCQKGVGMFNSEVEVYIPEKVHDALRAVYEKDIQKLAFESGGATCIDCGKSGGNNCKTCNIDYDYAFKDQELNGE